VKSAYKVALDSAERESDHGQTSSAASNGEIIDFVWKKLWTLLFPSKILHFLWAYGDIQFTSMNETKT
jgi:hypothetical protein